MSEKDTVPAKVFEVDIDQVHPNPDNPRTIKDANFKKLVKSIREFPAMLWKRPPVVVTTPNGYMALGGNKRTDAARAAGYKRIPVMLADEWDTDQRKRFVVLDNDQAGEWDFKMLTEQYSLSELLADTSIVIPNSLLATRDGAGEAVPLAPKDPVTRSGDIWLLGHHRLACGDSTSKEAVEALLAGARPNLMVTDPPYGVNYDPMWRARAGMNKNRDKMGEVQNDDKADWTRAWELFPGDVVYVWHAGIYSSTVQQSLLACGFIARQQIIWAKDRMVLSRGNYHWQHEPCWYAVRKGGKGNWTGDRSQTTLWSIPARDDSGHGHGTQKPLECMRRPIENNSNPGDQVYEPFSGSGTTIIACEQTGRVCFAQELEPTYVDIGVLRWQEFTGKEAVLEATGQTYAQVQEDRMG